VGVVCKPPGDLMIEVECQDTIIRGAERNTNRPWLRRWTARVELILIGPGLHSHHKSAEQPIASCKSR
jgi:hypothetical protein